MLIGQGRVSFVLIRRVSPDASSLKLSFLVCVGFSEHRDTTHDDDDDERAASTPTTSRLNLFLCVVFRIFSSSPLAVKLKGLATKVFSTPPPLSPPGSFFYEVLSLFTSSFFRIPTTEPIIVCGGPGFGPVRVGDLFFAFWLDLVGFYNVTLAYQSVW